MNRLVRPLVPIVILAGGALAARVIIASRSEVETQRPDPPAPLVRVTTVERGPHRFRVTTQGSVTPRTESALTAEVAGRVIAVSDNFEDGGFFEAGEVLLTIDPHDYESAVAQAKAQVAAAELRLAREEEEAEVAQREWERLRREGTPSALVLHEPQLAEAHAAVDAAKAALARAERDLGRTRIRAPYAGRIRDTNVDRGGFVGAGTPVARIYAVDSAEIRLPLPDDQLRYLDLPLDYRGDEDHESRPRVFLHASFAGRRHTWEGWVVRTEGEIDSRSRMVHVVARVDDPYARGEDRSRPPLAVGMFVEAEIEGRKIEDAAVLPRSALRGADQVLLVDDESRLRFREVQVIRLAGDHVVLGDGIASGEKVCLSPLDAVVDGMRVRTVEAETSEDAVMETAPPPSERPDSASTQGVSR